MAQLWQACAICSTSVKTANSGSWSGNLPSRRNASLALSLHSESKVKKAIVPGNPPGVSPAYPSQVCRHESSVPDHGWAAHRPPAPQQTVLSIPHRSAATSHQPQLAREGSLGFSHSCVMQVALAAATSIGRNLHLTLGRRLPRLSTRRKTVGQATQGSLGMRLMLPHRCAIWVPQGPLPA